MQISLKNRDSAIRGVRPHLTQFRIFVWGMLQFLRRTIIFSAPLARKKERKRAKKVSTSAFQLLSEWREKETTQQFRHVGEPFLRQKKLEPEIARKSGADVVY